MPTLWLIGMMGSGKSTVAPLVAGRLGKDWVDGDALIAAAAGASADAVLEQSEERFRTMETETIRAVAGSGMVVAAGGGAVTSPAAVEAMRDTGLVVWLRAPIETLVARVDGGEGRPLLDGDPVAALRRIEEQRRGLYEQACHVVVDSGGDDPDAVAVQVIAAWHREMS